MKKNTAMDTAIAPVGVLATILPPELPSGTVLVVVVVAGDTDDVALLKIAASGEFAGKPRSSVKKIIRFKII